MAHGMVTFQAAPTIGERLDRLVAGGYIKELSTSAAKPAGIPEKTIDEVEGEHGRAWYKKWWVWAVGGLTVTGIGLSVYLVRRRRR